MFSLYKLVGLLFTTVFVVSGYSNPGACSGHCWAHDPSVIQRASDGLYFKFNTGSGIEIATSSSLTGPWTLQGYVLPEGSSIDLTGNTDLWVCIHTSLNFTYYRG
jgi:arabinan endo-1,5-alpha-L-arabinosidase